jgi:hypothetical protein
MVHVCALQVAVHSFKFNPMYLKIRTVDSLETGKLVVVMQC